MRKWAPTFVLVAAVLVAAAGAQAPGWTALDAGTGSSLRGLCVVNARAVWVSGTRGVFRLTDDGGAHWRGGQVAGAEGVDFRDVKAFNATTAYLMGIAAAGGIFKTIDGGLHWTRQYAGSEPGFFLDSMAFWDADHGLALGDPQNGKFLLVRTSDGGAHWTPAEAMPAALAGEGGFAASGTTLVARGRAEAWFATGGTAGARVFHSTDGGKSWTVTPTPMGVSGAGATAGAGIFSLAFRDPHHGIAVGGDYQKPLQAARTAAISHDGGSTWKLAATSPAGYRSAVAYRPGCGGKTLVAVGPSGADISHDGGMSWQPLDPAGFNSIAFSADGRAWAAGERGHIATRAIACH